MREKYSIAVRRLCDGLLIKTVQRTLQRKAVHGIHYMLTAQVGNFSPLFCRYLGKKYLVRSEAGDLSDPFRRNCGYLDRLFIYVEED